jgi:hypothetical protein
MEELEVNYEDMIKRLQEPFAFKDVEWKIQVTTQDKARGMAVAYIDSRAIQNRLDEVIGTFNWRNAFMPWQNNAQLCGLSIYDSDRSEWVTKYDGAECTDIEPIKGGLSDSFKRAACVWGVGRYLYEINGIWVEVEQRGKSSVIKENQYAKLEMEYNKVVAQMFVAAVTPSSKQSATVSQSNPVTAASEYRVQSVKPSGKASQLLELVNADGEVISAYIKNSDEAVLPGSKLQNVDLVQKQSSYGQYNLINGYQIAA